MDRKILTIALVIAGLFVMGSASAQTVDLYPGNATVDSDGNFVLPVGQNVYETFGMQVQYRGWFDFKYGTYNVCVREGIHNPLGDVVYSDPMDTTDPAKPVPTCSKMASMSDADFDVRLAWTPTDAKYYTIYENGQAKASFRSGSDVTKAVPELPTSALMSVGLIGLVGLAKLRRKN